MVFSVNDLKAFCKEKDYHFHAASLLGGISENDSGKYDFSVETEEAVYACKVFSMPEDAERVYFMHTGGEYITVKETSGDEDFMWVPFTVCEKKGKNVIPVLLLDRDLPATERFKKSVVTVTAGALVYGVRVYTPSGFWKALS